MVQPPLDDFDDPMGLKLLDTAYNNFYTTAITNRSPEQNLLAAMLHRALLDATGMPSFNQWSKPQIEYSDKASAIHWIYDNEVFQTTFNFNFVCEALDLDAIAIRNALKSII